MHGCLHWYRNVEPDSKVAQTSASVKGLVYSSAELNGYVPALKRLAHPCSHTGVSKNIQKAFQHSCFPHHEKNKGIESFARIRN